MIKELIRKKREGKKIITIAIFFKFLNENSKVNTLRVSQFL